VAPRSLILTHPHLSWWFHDLSDSSLRPFREALDSNPVIADDWKAHWLIRACNWVMSTIMTSLEGRMISWLSPLHSLEPTWNILSCGIDELDVHCFAPVFEWYTLICRYFYPAILAQSPSLPAKSPIQMVARPLPCWVPQRLRNTAPGAQGQGDLSAGPSRSLRMFCFYSDLVDRLEHAEKCGTLHYCSSQVIATYIHYITLH
jgi:hypothetical protein